jgi:hypothetical protein
MLGRVCPPGVASWSIQASPWLSRMSATGSYETDVLGGLLLTAFGMGVVIPVASVSATAHMPPSERGR